MESSVEQFGVIHHQSQINSPELGSDEKIRKEEKKNGNTPLPGCLSK